MDVVGVVISLMDKLKRSLFAVLVSSILEDMRNIKSGFHNSVHDSYVEMGKRSEPFIVIL